MDPYNLEIFIYTKCYLNNLEGGMDEGGMAQVEICWGSMLGTVVILFCLLLWISQLFITKRKVPPKIYTAQRYHFSSMRLAKIQKFDNML